VTSYGLGDRGLILGRGRDYFSLRHHTQTGSGAHPVSYLMGTGGSYPRVKQPEGEGDHSPHFGAEVKKLWSCTYPSSYVFMAWCLVKHRDFTLLATRLAHRTLLTAEGDPCKKRGSSLCSTLNCSLRSTHNLPFWP
jgi:hypothetical protein